MREQKEPPVEFSPILFLKSLTFNYSCYFCHQSPFDLLVLDQDSSQAGFVIKPFCAVSESDSRSAGGSFGGNDAKGGFDWMQVLKHCQCVGGDWMQWARLGGQESSRMMQKF